ncbi:NADP-dependent malic enzyme [Streptomyces sp. DHE7-1]|nr:NADP-dependent malic enzyme [Streptomyces sp. DHE7-1]
MAPPTRQPGPARTAPGSLADTTREVLRLAAGQGGQALRSTVLVVSDGSSVLSRGDLGAHAVRPVLERKCAVLERATGMTGLPLALARAEPAAYADTLRLLRPNYDAILLADIAAPHCFELQRLLAAPHVGCPVVHDDQHGTAVMAAAAVHTAVARSGRTLGELCAVVVGAGAAGSTTARLLHHLGTGEVRVVDSTGLLHPGRARLTPDKAELAALTNPHGLRGPLGTALDGADVCVGLSGAPIAAADLARMNPKPVVVPLSYPDVEVRYEDAAALGATYLPALEHELSNNLATPGLLLAACRLGLRRPSMRDLATAAGCLVSQSAARPDARPDAPPLSGADLGRTARAIARAIAEDRAPSASLPER